jgi:hypothetical protein
VADGSLHWNEDFCGGAWLLTDYADVSSVLRDPAHAGSDMVPFEEALKRSLELRAMARERDGDMWNERSWAGCANSGGGVGRPNIRRTDFGMGQRNDFGMTFSPLA